MDNAFETTAPFLTRFFRAWAEDIEVPDIDKPGTKTDEHIGCTL